MIGVFLALLELIREKKILVHQEAVTDEMEIVPAPEEHRRTFIGASLHLAAETETEAEAAEEPAPAPEPSPALAAEPVVEPVAQPPDDTDHATE
jgi:hypothetical protein